MNIVFSRPIWSDTQPKNGRHMPLSTRSIVNAKVSAGSVSPSKRHRNARNLEVIGNGRQLRDRHQPARADRHEHHVHDVEHRRLEHLRPIHSRGVICCTA